MKNAPGEGTGPNRPREFLGKSLQAACPHAASRVGLHPSVSRVFHAFCVSFTRQPLVWLLVILGLALGLRAVKLNEPLQRDEFGAIYAVAERKTGSR